jgi:ABC-2 type transport system ATP-binding protein
LYAVEIEGLTKEFGELIAVNHLNLSVKKGSVFGFLGPNGAGKTTTLRLLMGLAKPTFGTAKILGRDIHKNMFDIRMRIGYLPDVPSFYHWMTAREYLMFVGELFSVPGRELDKRIKSLLKFADLSGVKTRIGGYSRGMKQRLGLAQAMVNKPEVLFLDEPTSALDPIGRKEVLDIIESLTEETTVFFSTHILNDVERVCDTIAILNKGRLMTESNLEELKSKYSQPIFLMEFDSEPAALERRLQNFSWVVGIERERNKLKIKVSDVRVGQIELPRLLSQTGVLLRNFEIVEPTLEEIFVETVKGK